MPLFYLKGCLNFWTKVSESLAPRLFFLSHLIPGNWMKSQVQANIAPGLLAPESPDHIARIL